MCVVAFPWVSVNWWMLSLLRDLLCGATSPPPKDTLNGSCMPLFLLRVSQLYASVRIDLGLGFLHK